MKIPNIIEEGVKEVSERASSFVVVYADIPLRVIMHGGRSTALQPVDLLNNTSLDLKHLRRYIIISEICNGATTRNTRVLTEENGFSRVLVIGSIEKKDGCGTVKVKDATDAIRSQVKYCLSNDVLFRPGC